MSCRILTKVDAVHGRYVACDAAKARARQLLAASALPHIHGTP